MSQPAFDSRRGVRPDAKPVVVEVATAHPGEASIGRVLRDYLTLTKPEITFLVTISALAGYVLGSGATLDMGTLFWALLGIAFASGGGGVLNHLEERELDAMMRRTAGRPLPAGRISSERARVFGYVLTALGLAILCPLTNPLTGVLAAGAVLFYIYVYTPLKRITPFNTLLGAVPGALPALGGWTAATGDIGLGGAAIFSVLFFWQMPHFMSLAWMYRKDYERAGYRMWTIGDEDGRRTARIAFAFTLLTIAASVVPTLLGISGWFYLTGALVLGVWFFRLAVQFARTRGMQEARSVLKGSIWYIPILLLFIVLDRLI